MTLPFHVQECPSDCSRLRLQPRCEEQERVSTTHVHVSRERWCCSTLKAPFMISLTIITLTPRWRILCIFRVAALLQVLSVRGFSSAMPDYQAKTKEETNFSVLIDLCCFPDNEERQDA